MANPTPLEAEIRRLIARAGPMPVAEYMGLCLTHPQFGYYMTRDPLGARGDFTTAPEISQMFGELVGLWAAAVWRHQLGAPENVRLVELGPGHGTLLADALRVAHIVPGFHKAVVLHLIEISPILQKRQRETLGGMDVPALWHQRLDEVPDGPVIIIANEFFDALPIRQCIKQQEGWHERLIGVDAARNLCFVLAPNPIAHFDRILPPKARDVPVGSVFEWRTDNTALELGRRVVRDRGAALVIDYGHTQSAPGDTLQAVGEHAFANPLSTPGRLDLTAHVDFQALGEAAESMGAAVNGPVTQAAFLRSLGIESRAEVLKNNARPAQVAEIETALVRLCGPDRRQMGALFKAIALSHPELGPLPGFE
jgi:NADH dehydrogenase [ubiquinone] 1 alpha subcomplex assembly factor 7